VRIDARLRQLFPLGFVALALAAGGCKLTRSDHCAVPETSLGTYELMRSSDAPAECPPTLVLLSVDTGVTGAEQVRVEAIPLTFVPPAPPNIPDAAAGALAAEETLAVALDPSMDGIEVTFRVTGVLNGRPVAAGETTVLANAANIVPATVVLVTCPELTGPACGAGEAALLDCDDAGFETVTDCAFGCNTTRVECNDCTPGADECHGSLAVHCGPDGLAVTTVGCWATPANPNRRCEAGDCVNL
jgi:hypothetical protein